MPKKSFLWNQRNRKLIISLIGFFLGLFGILCGMFWEEILKSIIKKKFVLRPNTDIYDNWKKPPIPMSLDIYLFNWTNPGDFQNRSTKPILQQLGPYRFVEKPDKVDIRWHPENSSVTYRRKSYYYFDAEGSAGSLEDSVSTLNAVALSAGNKAKQWNTMRRKMVDVGFKMYNQEISVIKTVDELLFTGYQDDMIDVARTMPLFGSEVQVPFDKFGWFYTRNGSADLTGTFNVYTGADDRSKLGQMHTWNYVRHTGFFDSYCGLTNGSAGEFQPPHLKVNGSVALFTPDMCRTVPLDYVEEKTVEGIAGYKYAGGIRSVDNGTLYEENKCFCGGLCSPSGVMNITSCRFGSPVFMSYPHFYNADQFFVNQVEGLEPKAEDHEFYMILEPENGLALEVAARFQVNMLVEPIQSISLYEGVPRIYFPLIWFEQKVRITPDLASNIKMIPIVRRSGEIVAAICLALGLILLFWYPIDFLIRGRRIQNVMSVHPVVNENNTSKDTELKAPKLISAEITGAPNTPLLEKSVQASPTTANTEKNSESAHVVMK